MHAVCGFFYLTMLNIKSVGGVWGVRGKLEHLESLLVKTFVRCDLILAECSRHLGKVIMTLKLFDEFPQQDIFSCDPRLAGNVDSVKPGSTFFHQVPSYSMTCNLLLRPATLQDLHLTSPISNQ